MAFVETVTDTCKGSWRTCKINKRFSKGQTAMQQANVIVLAPEEMTIAASSGVEWLQQAGASWDICQALLHSVPAGNMEL